MNPQVCDEGAGQPRQFATTRWSLILSAVNWAERDFSGALAEFRAARARAPNDADTIEAVAYVQRRLGHFDEAIAELHRAIELDPRHVMAYQDLAETLGHLRRFPEALAAAESASILQPADAASLRLKANLLWRSTGNVQAVEPLLANSLAIPETRARQFLFQRDYAAAIGVLSKSLPATTADQHMGGYLPERQQLQLLLGLSQQRAGDASAARATYQQTVLDIQRALAGVASGSNMEAALHSALGEADQVWTKQMPRSTRDSQRQPEFRLPKMPETVPCLKKKWRVSLHS